MKPINVARFMRVFSFVAMMTLAIEVKLGHLDDNMWVFPLVSLVLLYMHIVSWSLIDAYKKEQQNP